MIQLPRQMAQRIRAWNNELPRHQYTPIGPVAFEGFTTLDRIPAAQAADMPRRPFPVGTSWGACWEYAWFTGEVTLPPSCRGQRVVFFSGLGGEQLVYVNGRAAGSIDREHHYVTLTRCAEGGETFRLLIESYAGHGERIENLGPVPPERKAIPPVPEAQCRVAESFIAVWNEDAYQLLMDVNTLSQLLEILPDKSLRAQKVAKALADYTHVADFELPMEARHESFRRAREVLRPALECHNGSTAPTMWLIANSHIDLAWLWPAEETFHKSARTYSNQLALMEEYPEYRFLLCEPALLEMLKAFDPAIWQRVKDAHARGQIIADGVFFVECDSNFPGGESIIRQLMWGRKWYQENLGETPQVAWHPDSFGYSAALPQLLRAFGVNYFATQKLLRADPECERFPYQDFVWEGMDGSTVLANSFFDYTSKVSPLHFHRRWEQHRVQQTDIDTLLYPYGYGDGGGGPDRDMLEMVRRMTDLEGAPRAHEGTLLEFFRQMEQHPPKNRWVGELYLSWHRGTYTTMHKTKQLLRRAERGIHDAEALLARLPRETQEIHASRVKKAWETLLFCQFHDVASGVGVRRMNEETVAGLTRVAEDMAELNQQLRREVCAIREGSGLVLVNTLPWDRREWVALPDGRELYAEIPADGAVMADASLPQPDDASAKACADGFLLENRFLSLRMDPAGRITALTDRENGAPLMHPGQRMNDWRLYQNVESVYDAWEMSRDWQQCLLPDAITASAALTECTPARCAVTVQYAFGNSTATQQIILRAASRRVDFVTHIDWQERHRLLKTHFEANILAEDALHEIQFGYVRRPCHASHAFAADRYEVCNQRYTALCEENRGFALLNESTCGLSTDRGEIALSLLRAPLAPDDTCDVGQHDLTYALYPFATGFGASGVTRAGYELNAPVEVLPGECARQSGFRCDSASILLETVKPAEDGDGLILRLYESLRMQGDAAVHAPMPGKWYLCDMPESCRGELLGEGREISLRLAPFKIATLRFLPD
ncbi:MAG: alpha-mannosidase [Aristaeellaceae bacterium]